jgi:hypothetical protein
MQAPPVFVPEAGIDAEGFAALPVGSAAASGFIHAVAHLVYPQGVSISAADARRNV